MGKAQQAESDRWQKRFAAYLGAGPSRSLLGTYRAALPDPALARRRPTAAPNSWRLAARRYRWRERAASHDAVEAEHRREAAAAATQEEARWLVLAELLPLEAVARLLEGIDPATLTVAGLMDYLQAGILLERRAMEIAHRDGHRLELCDTAKACQDAGRQTIEAIPWPQIGADQQPDAVEVGPGATVEHRPAA